MTLQSVYANMTKSLPKLQTTHTRMLICDVYDRDDLELRQLQWIHDWQKYIYLNLS